MPEDTPVNLHQTMSTVLHHYENFTVASRVLSGDLRNDLAAIYVFSRLADDFADDLADPQQALTELNRWGLLLSEAVEGRAADPFFRRLADTISRRRLTARYFFDLLDAFRMDVNKKRWRDWSDLRDYTRLSADPVGRLVLELNDYRDPALFALSDNICTALQLINHLQDIGEDWQRGRFYFPMDELDAAGATLDDLKDGELRPAFRRCLSRQADRARSLMTAGMPLLSSVKPRLRFQLALYIEGGLAALRRVERTGFKVLDRRTRLNRLEKALVGCHAAVTFGRAAL